MSNPLQTTSHGSRVSGLGSRVSDHGDEINLLDYWRVLQKHRRMIAGIVATASIVVVVVSLLMTKTYRAEALIVPVGSRAGGGGGIASLSGQLGGLAQIAGITFPGSDDTAKLVSILKSRTVTENVVKRENLMPLLFPRAWDSRRDAWKSADPERQPDMEKAVEKMKKHMVVMDDKKTKAIKITGEFRSPAVAARAVNAYLDELQNFINANAFTTAKRNRIFIEEQLEENKQELLEAGKEINEFYKSGRVSSAEAKVDVPIARKAETRDTRHETRDLNKPLMALNNPPQDSAVAGDRTQASDDARVSNDDAEVSALLTQKSELDKKITEARVVQNVPQQVYLSYLMLRRELLGKVNALLTTQYEMAKIEESKEDLAFQVIDRAVPPVKKFKPKRAQICIMAFVASLIGAILLAFFREYLARMKAGDVSRSATL